MALVRARAGALGHAWERARARGRRCRVAARRLLTLVAIADSLDVSLDFLVRGIRDNSGL